MLRAEKLKTLLHKREYTQKEKILLVLASDAERPMPTALIKKIAVNNGLRKAKQWNIAAHLRSGPVYAIRIKEGWELTEDGRKHITERAPQSLKSVTMKASVDLRRCLDQIKDTQTAAFVEEAIGCLEDGRLRAAVVLSWVGAISILYGHVLKYQLKEFNAEAKKRYAKWKPAKTADDLARMKEYDFLEVLDGISIIGKNVKQELQDNCLRLRNACGHPSSLRVGENRVASHIEVLILNVFSHYS